MDKSGLKELFVEHIRYLYDAEQQLVVALPKMAEAADSEELAAAIRQLLEETRTQLSRLEEVFRITQSSVKGFLCNGMKGLLQDHDEGIGAYRAGPLRDLAMIASAAKAGHYQVAAYGCAVAMAERLEMEDVVDLVKRSEEEESAANGALTEIAKRILARAGDDVEQGPDEGGDDEDGGFGDIPAPVQAS